MVYGMDKFKFVFFLHSGTSNSKVDSRIWLKLVQEFKVVLNIFKFHNDVIKINTLLGTMINMDLFGFQGLVTPK